jgi:hypothetical protein
MERGVVHVNIQRAFLPDSQKHGPLVFCLFVKYANEVVSTNPFLVERYGVRVSSCYLSPYVAPHSTESAIVSLMMRTDASTVP